MNLTIYSKQQHTIQYLLNEKIPADTAAIGLHRQINNGE